MAGSAAMLDLNALHDAVEAEGRIARVVITDHKGSTPREAGTAMLVCPDRIIGTIGGGRLEYDATARAREMLQGDAEIRVLRQPLGPSLGQCCGGSVTLVTEIWDAPRLRAVFDHGTFEFAGLYVRRVEGDAPLPPKLRRALMRAADRSEAVRTQLSDGWLIEQLWRDRLPVYIYGAGHVGNALARVMAMLPDVEVIVADPRADLIADLPACVACITDRPPHEVMAGAPPEAFHYIMTPDHEYDLELCHCVLNQPFAFAGLIGSETKWARFRNRLAALGHSADRIARITCPIGDPALGKHPAEIAIGVTQALLARHDTPAQNKEQRA